LEFVKAHLLKLRHSSREERTELMERRSCPHDKQRRRRRTRRRRRLEGRRRHGTKRRRVDIRQGGRTRQLMRMIA